MAMNKREEGTESIIHCWMWRWIGFSLKHDFDTTINLSGKTINYLHMTFGVLVEPEDDDEGSIIFYLHINVLLLSS